MGRKIGVLFLFLLFLPLVHADLGDTLKNAWETVLSVGSLGFLGVSPDTAVVAFTRLLILFFVFAVLYGVLSGFGGEAGPLSFLSRGQAVAVALVISIIAAIFMPASVLLAVGTSWATAVALILLLLPILGFAFLLWTLPNDSCGWKFIKLIMTILLFWIVSSMKYHVSRLSASQATAVTASINQFIDWSLGVIALLILYYIYQFLTCRGKSNSYQEAGEKRREALKDLIDKIKKKKKDDDDDKDDDKDDKDKKKKKKKKRIVKKIGGALIVVVDTVKDTIKELAKPDDAKKLFTKAKRLMTKELADSRVILELAAGTPHLAEAQRIVGMLQAIRMRMDSITLTEPELKRLNADIGVAMKLIGELIRNVNV